MSLVRLVDLTPDLLARFAGGRFHVVNEVEKYEIEAVIELARLEQRDLRLTLSSEKWLGGTPSDVGPDVDYSLEFFRVEFSPNSITLRGQRPIFWEVAVLELPPNRPPLMPTDDDLLAGYVGRDVEVHLNGGALKSGGWTLRGPVAEARVLGDELVVKCDWIAKLDNPGEYAMTPTTELRWPASSITVSKQTGSDRLVCTGQNFLMLFFGPGDRKLDRSRFCSADS